MNLISLNMANYVDFPPQGKFINRNYHILQQLEKEQGEKDFHVFVDFVPFGQRRQLKNFTKVNAGLMRYPIVKLGAWYIIRKITDRKYVVLTWQNSLTKKRQQFIWQAIERFARGLSDEDWVLWSYQPHFSEAFNSDFCAKKVFDVVDDWRAHDIHRDKKDFLDQSYQNICQGSDTVFAVSEKALEVMQGHKNAHWVPNGVEIERFADTYPSKSSDKPVIGFVGIIENRLDSALISGLAQRNPQWLFKFAGKVFPNFEGKNLEKLPNITFLGQIPYKQVPQFFSTLNVGIVPHKINDFTHSMNPLKIYEYLAAGLPCVTTPVAGSDMFENRVIIANNIDEFERGIKQALDNNTKEDIDSRKQFITKFSWDKRFLEMQKWI